MNIFLILEQTKSTNKDALKIIHDGKAVDGLSVFTSNQDQGHGRRGNVWLSEPGMNIALSIITCMENHPVRHQPILSMITGLSVIQLIEQNTALKPSVKWPNDVFVDDKKISGILVENTLLGQKWKWAVAGFGININQTNFHENLNATSLKLCTHKGYDIIRLAKEFKKIYLNNIRQWENHDWLSLYNQKLYKRGTLVTMKTKTTTFQTIIQGVDINGNLITQDNTVRKWTLNEIKMVL